jgi:hypothetical protein
MSAVLRNSHGTEVHVICTGAVIQRLLVRKSPRYGCK